MGVHAAVARYLRFGAAVVGDATPAPAQGFPAGSGQQHSVRSGFDMAPRAEAAQGAAAAAEGSALAAPAGVVGSAREGALQLLHAAAPRVR